MKINTEKIKNKIGEISKILEKYGGYFSSFGVVFGLIITPFTLTRIDNTIQDIVIILQIFLAMVGIIVLNYLENEKIKGRIDIKKHETIKYWLIFGIQFLFGNLFSAYIVLYFISSTLFVSWPFILLIFALLVGNELLKKHYSRLTMQICTIFLSIYLFSIFYLPIIVNRIGDDIFLYSGLFSVLFIVILILILWKITKENFLKHWKGLVWSLGGIIILINGMYFLNIIPPIPISIKEIGTYHDITKDTKGNYILESENTTSSIEDFFKLRETYHRYDNEPVYVFSSIFSPTDFDTKIIHEWQYYNKVTKKWISSAKIELPIVGSRSAGYRTYSEKNNLNEGLWRVNVLTSKGRVIGRINFEIVNVNVEPVVEYIKI
jgi:hypothetical protein